MNKTIEKIIGTMIYIVVGHWILLGSKIRYGIKKKTNYGYCQEYWLEVWGKRVA